MWPDVLKQHIYIYVCVCVKVKIALDEAMNAQRASSSTALHLL